MASARMGKGGTLPRRPHACQPILLHAAFGLAGRVFHAFSAVIALRAPSVVRKRMESTLKNVLSHPVRASSSQTRAPCTSRHNSRIRSSCAKVAMPGRSP